MWAAIAAAAVATVAVLLPVLTNLVTGTSPTRWMWWGFGLLAVGSISIAAHQGARAVKRAHAQRRAELEAARERVLRPFPSPPVGPGTGRPGVLALVDPMQRTPRIAARAHELHELSEWCTDEGIADRPGDHVSQHVSPVRVLEGAGGLGKTRVAIELAEGLAPRWYCGTPVTGNLSAVLEAVAACEDPTLIVVDDADIRPEVRTLLEDVLRHDQTKTWVRVLLLVRDATVFQAWIAREGSAQLARSWPRTTLRAFGQDGDRRRWFLAALRAYRSALVPDDHDAATTVTLPAPADLGSVGVDGEPFLVTCLRAALAAEDGGTLVAVTRVRAAGTTELASQLVAYERRRWTQAALDPSHALSGVSADARADAVLALVVTNPVNRGEAIAVLEHLQRLDGQPRATLDALVTWTSHLYHPDRSNGAGLVAPKSAFLGAALVAAAVGPHQPDTTVSAANASPAVASQLDWNHVAPGAATFQSLTRAAVWFPHVSSLIADVLAHHPEAVIAAIEAVALAGSGARSALAPTLVAGLNVHEPGNGQIASLLELCGTGTGLGRVRVALRRIAVARIHTASSSDDSRAKERFAVAVSDLSKDLAAVGEYREALARIQEAVALYRRLAAEEPARYTGDLARALGHLGSRLRDLGEYRESLAAAQEALHLFRRLAAEEPARYTRNLAFALNNLGNSLGYLGEYQGAVARTQEAVALFRQLAVEEPARYTNHLALALNNLAVGLGNLSAYTESLANAQEAVHLFQGLAAELPARYGGDLALSLTNLGVRLGALGAYREAVASTQEAIELRRALAAKEPAFHTSYLARELDNLGIWLGRLGAYREAVASTQEAIELRRALAAEEPALHTSYLAESLNNVGFPLAHLGEQQEALTYMAEAVAWRARMTRLSDEYTPIYRDARAALARAYKRAGYDIDAVYRAERDAAERLPGLPQAQTD